MYARTRASKSDGTQIQPQHQLLSQAWGSLEAGDSFILIASYEINLIVPDDRIIQIPSIPQRVDCLLFPLYYPSIIEPEPSYFRSTTLPPPSVATETYQEVEKRISEAIAAINSRENVHRNKIAQEFRVSVQRLRSRLNGNPPASDVHGLHLRKLAPDQEKALHNYFIQLGMPTYSVHMIEQAANSLLRMSSDPAVPPPFVGPQWAKRRLNRQEDLFKVKRKPIAAARINAHDPELLMEYFMMYKLVVDEFGILPGDQWNFDETGYCMGIARED